MFGFLEYFFFNFSIVVLLTKLNPVVVCWKPWPFSWIFLVKTALWLVLFDFFCVFSRSESICNLRSCYTFCTRVTEELHSFLSQSELSNFFVYINSTFILEVMVQLSSDIHQILNQIRSKVGVVGIHGNFTVGVTRSKHDDVTRFQVENTGWVRGTMVAFSRPRGLKKGHGFAIDINIDPSIAVIEGV